MSKILKCAGGEDTVTLRAWDNPESIVFIFESQNKDKLAEYDMKLINMDQEHLGIPVRFIFIYTSNKIKLYVMFLLFIFTGNYIFLCCKNAICRVYSYM